MTLANYLIVYDIATGQRQVTVRQDLDFLYNADGSHQIDEYGNWIVGIVSSDDNLLEPHKQNLQPGQAWVMIPIEMYNSIGPDAFLAQHIASIASAVT